MKLVRFGPRGREKPGILDPRGRIRDLSALIRTWPARPVAQSLAKIRKHPIEKLPLVPGNPRWAPASAMSAT
jgi:hypothetical protein